MTRRPKLADKVIEALRQRIDDGDLRPGDRLPTEPALVESFGVSRTVVREAIAALAADGRVEARQGSGVFVLAPAEDRLTILVPEAHDRLTTVLNVLELRTAIEVEAAALAARRRSGAQEAAMREAFAAFEAAMRGGGGTAPADFAFHLTIAEATNNPLFPQSLETLGHRTIPRDFLAAIAGDAIHGPAYLARIHAEHAAILSAIAEGDGDGAALAMRAHLSRSRDRYQLLLQAHLARSGGAETAPSPGRAGDALSGAGSIVAESGRAPRPPRAN